MEDHGNTVATDSINAPLLFEPYAGDIALTPDGLRYLGMIPRGTERKTKTPTQFKQLCDRLRQAGSSDVRGVTFEVKPKP